MRKNFCRQGIIFVLFLSPFYVFAQDVKVKNVILMIGDGMGLNQLYAAKNKQANLNIERCPVVGLSKTYSANDYTTDSGAGGTAIASGVKTNNHMIGVSPDGKTLKSIMKIADEAGKATGLVVTCDVVNATPASFVAHQDSRYKYKEIAKDYLSSEIEVFIGGGRRFFDKEMLQALKDKGYQIAEDMDAVALVQKGKLAGLIDNGNPPEASKRNDLLYLGTQKALELLNQNEQGFFLMIEGSQIDWKAHRNLFDDMVEEVLDFDKTVGLALDFAEKDGNTLVVVTADHETGGLALLERDAKTGKLKYKYTTKVHSGMPVPVYAYGPGAELFTGFYENTAIFRKISQLYGFDTNKR